VEDLMASKAVWQPGLIEEAGGGPEPGMLYIDEVNLLDDHLANLILDVASTGILTIQRDSAAREPKQVRFSLVGTMNPEEGNLRPQLLDRFGLVVRVGSARSPDERRQILEAVLRFDEESQHPSSEHLAAGYASDLARKQLLLAAKERLFQVRVPDKIIELAAAIAAAFGVEGHRGEVEMLRAARALASIEKKRAVSRDNIETVAPLALIHRRAASESGSLLDWSAADTELLLSVRA
jgi:magnesium chelatase subunit I